MMQKAFKNLLPKARFYSCTWSSLCYVKKKIPGQLPLVRKQTFNRDSLEKNVTLKDFGSRIISTSAIYQVPISEKPKIADDAGSLKKLGRKIKWVFWTKSKLLVAAHYMYEACTDEVDFQEFFNYLKLPDTFLSWFLVTELHVWMCLVRVMRENEEGRFMRNKITLAMWTDVETRIKKLDEVSSSARKKGLNDMLEQFQAAIFAYDEGLLKDDTVLAGAIWRILLHYNYAEPTVLETIVYYIRKQISHLDSLSTDNQVKKGKISWIPFKNIVAEMQYKQKNEAL